MTSAAASPELVGIIEIDATHQLRILLAEEKGVPILDVRGFDLFAGVWMGNKRGVTLPLTQLEALGRLVDRAAALTIGGRA